MTRTFFLLLWLMTLLSCFSNCCFASLGYETTLNIMLDGQQRLALSSEENAYQKNGSRAIRQAALAACQEVGLSEVVGEPILQETYQTIQGLSLHYPWEYRHPLVNTFIISDRLDALIAACGSAFATTGLLNMACKHLQGHSSKLDLASSGALTLLALPFAKLSHDFLVASLRNSYAIDPGTPAPENIVWNGIRLHSIQREKPTYRDSSIQAPHLLFQELKCKGKKSQISALWLSQFNQNPLLASQFSFLTSDPRAYEIQNGVQTLIRTSLIAVLEKMTEGSEFNLEDQIPSLDTFESLD